jgi:hypothetical protein
VRVIVAVMPMAGGGAVFTLKLMRSATYMMMGQPRSEIC